MGTKTTNGSGEIDLTLAEAAARIGCSEQSVRRRLAEGELRSRLRAGRRFVEAASVDEYLAKRSGGKQA